MAEIEKAYVDVLAEIITLWFGITGREGSIEREQRGIRMCRNQRLMGSERWTLYVEAQGGKGCRSLSLEGRRKMQRYRGAY